MADISITELYQDQARIVFRTASRYALNVAGISKQPPDSLMASPTAPVCGVNFSTPVLAAFGGTVLSALTSFRLSRRKSRRNSYMSLWASLDGPDFDHELMPCKLCRGTGKFPCETCRGMGALPPGGFSRRNTISHNRVVGTQWTAVSAIKGKWRHFRCVAKKGRFAKEAVAVLAGACGPQKHRLVVDVPLSDLKKRDLWTSGWVTLQDIRRADGVGGVPGPTCMSCAGEKQVACPRCDGRGKV